MCVVGDLRTRAQAVVDFPHDTANLVKQLSTSLRKFHKDVETLKPYLYTKPKHNLIETAVSEGDRISVGEQLSSSQRKFHIDVENA